VIARLEGGGGHRQAAGFSTEKRGDELIEFILAGIASQL
jgi:nanoRNase/pAp phosphatase (c-di-AMP/oligoRNAs hydrolase)